MIDSKLTGKGALPLPDGSVYEGDFVDGKRHGRLFNDPVQLGKLQGDYTASSVTKQQLCAGV